ncbi:MAG: DUF1573 domain-containing protein [Pirellulales bacterium]
MLRQSLILAFVVSCALTAPAAAESWVDKMVTTQKHDFGTVARGADTIFRFPIKNVYKQDIELVSVRSSCGCTSPSLENKSLKTGDVGYVVASFNTRTFTGVHGATLTLTVAWTDKGTRRTGETQLRVDGNIRGDIVIQPGTVKFENIEQGLASEQKAQVTYAGRRDWKIVDVRGASDDIEVELTEKQRTASRVAYELLVRLKKSAAAGYFTQQLVLITNDEKNPRIPLDVAGRVVPQISVAPESLLLGNVPRGEEVSKKVVVRGKTPFRILAVKCDEEGFQFKTDEESKEMHIIEIVFAPKRDAGQVKQTIHITTDMGESYRPTLTAYATVVTGATDTAERKPGDSEIRPNSASAGKASSGSVVSD